MPPVSKAFILGAGLGTRLRPLTEQVPKPMIPVWNKPLITYAFDHLIADAATSAFMVNTHHCAEVYDATFPDRTYRECSLEFRHEDVLLETAGGIANVADWLPKDDSFFVYNGDILTDLPLGPAIEAHEASGNLVTMVLRSEGAAPHVSWNESTGKVVDIRNLLKTDTGFPGFQFTGIYLVRPAFLDFLTPGKIESVVWPFLEVIKTCDGIGGAVIDGGDWSDLGTTESYLEASASMNESFPRYGKQSDQVRIHPDARIDPAASVSADSSIGPGAEIGPGARVTRSILWGGASVSGNLAIKDSVIRTT